MNQLILKSISRHVKYKSNRSSQHGFTKSFFTNVMTFNNKLTVSSDEGRTWLEFYIFPLKILTEKLVKYELDEQTVEVHWKMAEWSDPEGSA